MQYFHIPSCVRVYLGYSQPSSASHFASYLLGGATHSMRDGLRRGMARELANNKSAFAIECDLSILSSTWLPYYYHYYNPPDCRSISVSPSESAATVRWYNHTPSITFLLCLPLESGQSSPECWVALLLELLSPSSSFIASQVRYTLIEMAGVCTDINFNVIIYEMCHLESDGMRRALGSPVANEPATCLT